MIDPRNLSPDELRAMLQETYGAIQQAWIAQACGYDLVIEKKHWRAWHFESLDAYLRRDMPELPETTVLMMVEVFGYLKSRYPALVETALSSEDSTTLFPGYEAVKALYSLEGKKADVSSIAADVLGTEPQEEQVGVSQQEIASLWEATLAGELTGAAVHKQAVALKKGLTFAWTRNSKFSAEERRLFKLTNDVSSLVVGIDGLKPLVATNKMPLVPTKGLLLGITRLVLTVRSVFGEEAFNTIFSPSAKYAGQESGSKREERLRLSESREEEVI